MKWQVIRQTSDKPEKVEECDTQEEAEIEAQARRDRGERIIVKHGGEGHEKGESRLVPPRVRPPEASPDR